MISAIVVSLAIASTSFRLGIVILVSCEVIFALGRCVALLLEVNHPLFLPILTRLALLATIQKLVFVLLLKLLLDFQLVLHDLLLGLQKQCLLSQIDPLPLKLSRASVLQAHVEVDADFARVFRLEAKPIHDVRLTLFIYKLSSDQLFKFMYPDGASEEEGMDLRLQRATRPPCLHLKLVIAWLTREPHETVTFDAVAAPRVY